MSIGEDVTDKRELESNANYHGLRDLLREANAPLVADIFSRLLYAEDGLLELGCGTGELYRLMPEPYRHHYRGLELHSTILDINRDMYPEAELMVGDATNLPFESSSLPAIVAMNLLDAVPDHKAVMHEVERTLAPSGVFVHLHDCRPSMDFVVRQLPGELIPFPYEEHNGSLMRFRLLSLEAYRQMQKDDKLDFYVDRMQLGDDFLEPLRVGHPETVPAINTILDRDFAAGLEFSPTFREIFDQALIESAADANLTVEELREYRGQVTMRPDQLAKLQASYPVAPPYKTGSVLVADVNGGMSYSPIQSANRNPWPTYLSSLSVGVFRKNEAVAKAA